MYNREIGQIESVLLHGEECALSTKELLSITGHKSGRVLQSAIQVERELGALILSSHQGGYYLPSEHPLTALSEINRCTRTMRSRAKNTNRTARALEKSAASTPPGQLSMFNDVSAESGNQNHITKRRSQEQDIHQ